uniref:Uncharacterized protein n=1 Tax=Ammonifex degensii TaxID=42838 RepID=A0A7C2EBF8_9THEO
MKNGRAQVFIFPDRLPAYAEHGFSLPPKAAEGDQLHVFGVFAGEEAVFHADLLARAAGIFPNVYVYGIGREGKLMQIDAVAFLRDLLRRMGAAGGARGFIREQGITSLDNARVIKSFWRDYCEGRVLL